MPTAPLTLLFFSDPTRLQQQWQAMFGQLGMVRYIRLRYRWHRIYTTPNTCTIVKDILYSTEASKLDVYHDRPPPPPSDDRNTVDGPKELRPCAIFIHGGAWYVIYSKTISSLYYLRLAGVLLLLLLFSKD